MNFDEIIKNHLDGHLDAAARLRAQSAFLEKLGRRAITCLESERKLIFFGNGGSAADAQHLATEFVVRYRRNRRALAAIALTTDTSSLTAGANDFGFESVFARQIEALAREGDMVFGISTSGGSANVITGLLAAKEKRCVTVAFTGSAPSRCSEIADLTFLAPSNVTAHIQECHITAGHILCELVETHFIGR
jgi:D-sedoheptulose 7-phosphate isomerase